MIVKGREVIKGPDLPAKLKEYGIIIDDTYANYIPTGGKSYVERSGLLKNGEFEEVWYFDLEYTLQFFADIAEYDLCGKLRELGFELDPLKLKYFPFTYLNGKHCYDLEKSITFYHSTNPHNIQAKLKERGYEIDDAYLADIIRNCSSLYDEQNGFSHYNIETIIRYVNSINKYNLRQKLDEAGCVVDDIVLKQIKSVFYLGTFSDCGITYNLDDVKKYVEYLSAKKIVMNKEPNQIQSDAHSDEFFGPNPHEYYSQVSNLYSRFPISKWYAEKYNTIPDVCFVGQIYIDDLLEEPSYKIHWILKNFTSYTPVDDYKETTNVLRTFESERKHEYLVEALIEITDGMFILLCDGNFERKDKNLMYATTILFYKEGIHDTTEFLRAACDKHVTHDDSGTLGLLYHNQNGFDTQDFTIPEPKVDFNFHYNEGFEDVHNKIHRALSEDRSKGLVLLHGKPGTGKTTYIRYLINKINKNKIFVPPNLTELLSDPGFIPFLMSNPNCILFVEDAENVLRSRDDGQNNQAVSNILNITDGLLSDCLNIQIVATFNTHLKNIDSALLRKGRLISQYEFTDLVPERAEKLADSLKVWLDDTDNLTVADIYAAQGKTN